MHLSPRNKFKRIKGTLIVRFPKNLHVIHFFKIFSIYKQFITKLRIYSECTSNSLSPHTFPTVIRYIDNYPPISSDLNAIESVCVWVNKYIQRNGPNSQQHLERLVQQAWNRMPKT